MGNLNSSSGALVPAGTKAGAFAGRAWKLAIALVVAIGLTLTLQPAKAHASGKFLAGAIVGGLVAGALIHHAHRHHGYKRVRVARYHRRHHNYRVARHHYPVLILPVPVIVIGGY